VREFQIVLGGTGTNMIDHLCLAAPTASQQIAFAEGLQESFVLIEPRGIGWSQQHLDPRRSCCQERSRVITGVAGAIVHDQTRSVRLAQA